MSNSFKIMLVIFAAVVFSAAVWIIVLNIKLSSAKTQNLELKAEITQKDTQIAAAEFAVSNQNERMKQYIIDTEAKDTIYQKELKRIEDKYLYEKSLVRLDNATCEDKLSAINEAQKRFCYE